MRRLSITKRADGYLTVFFSLTMTVLLTLILALIAGARVGAAKQRSEIVTDIAMNSALAEYHRELFTRYGLLFVDLSYGTPFANVVNTEEHIRRYIRGNVRGNPAGGLIGTTDFAKLNTEAVRISQYSLATDNDCAVLRRQILSYMAGEPVGAAFSEAAENLVILRSEGYDTTDVGEIRRENDEKRRELMDSAGMTEEEIEEVPFGEIENANRLDALRLAHPKPETISNAAITPSIYLSGRDRSAGTGLDDSESFTAADLMLFDQYLFEKCGNHQHPREDTRLKYELEYILSGKGNDRENLLQVAKTLFFWREAANFAYIMTDELKVAQAELIGTVVALLTTQAELEEVVKMSVLLAWSFGESVTDLRTLFAGKKVPLVKTRDTWTLSLLQLPFFAKTEGKGDQGLDYEAYLRMLMLTCDVREKTLRLCDIMEMDIRKTPGNQNFRMDACMDCFTAEVSFTGPFGYEATLIRTSGYDMSGRP